jgi:hypothetical protein
MVIQHQEVVTTVGGGCGNAASGNCSTVRGGAGNTASSTWVQQ